MARPARLVWDRRSLGVLLGWVTICCVVLSTVAVLSNPLPQPVITPTPSSQTQPQKLTKVVFFGSSTTVGVGSTRGDRRWSTLLARYLGWQEINEGLSGSTVSLAPLDNKPQPVASGVERWRSNVLPRHPDRVMLLYGVNDAFFRIPLGNASAYGTYHGDLTRMLTEMAKEFKPSQLIITSSQPNQATLDRREAYDRLLQQTTHQIGGYFIDGSAAFERSALADNSADGLHLNNFGHAIFASYLANKLVDLGLEPAPPHAQGGNNLLASQLEPLPGGFFRIDLAHPLTFGRLRTIAATWVAPGRARLAIVRPDGRGGYEAIYRTPIFDVVPGSGKIDVPDWWVLDYDRLAVWTEGDCLGGYRLAPAPQGHLSVSQGSTIGDLPATRGEIRPHELAIRTLSSSG
jgi:lysophospholipase L1-like esterase